MLPHQAAVVMMATVALLTVVSAHYAYYVAEVTARTRLITESVELRLPSTVVCAAKCISTGCLSIGFEEGGDMKLLRNYLGTIAWSLQIRISLT